MSKTSSNQPAEKKELVNKAESLYLRVADHLRQCVSQGVLRERTIITETSISRIFKISRTPVRHALTILKKEGCIQPGKKRGYVVGIKTKGELLKLTPTMLKLASGQDFLAPAKEWERIHNLIENDFVRLSVLSRWRINAVELARAYSTTRSTIYEILSRMEVCGLVERNYQSRWTIAPLDEKRLNSIFDVRSWLEPNLLAQAMPQIPKKTLEQVIEHHKSALSRYPDTSGFELNQLEIDIHERLLQYADNHVAMVALKTAKAGLISSKHIVDSTEVPLGDEDPFLEEHLSILESIYRENSDESRLRLQAHLLKSRQKVLERLRQFRTAIEKKPTKFSKRYKSYVQPRM